MKSPQFFLQDEQHNAVEPVLAIRRAQADAILHALKAIRTLPLHRADDALSTMGFELMVDEPQPEYRKPTLIEGRKLRFLRAMIKVSTQREAAIMKGMEI